jgi:hypothetical protein
MKNSIKVFLASILLLCSTSMFAEDVDIITLTTTAEGKTQDEAVTNALRSAIEQAFGTFISSKTDIVNDELIRDEIVSISNGNVQKYDVFSSTTLPNGNTVVSVKADVSITKLTTFAQSKGVEVEFEGGLFAANIKLQELYAKNEMEVLDNLVIPFSELVKKAYDYKIIAKDPIKDEIHDRYGGITKYYLESIDSNYDDYKRNFMKNGGNKKENSITNKIQTNNASRRAEIGEILYANARKSELIWKVPLTIEAAANQNFFSAIELLFNILNSISLSKEDAKNYIKTKRRIYPISFAITDKKYQLFYLRSPQSIVNLWGFFEELKIALFCAKIDTDMHSYDLSSFPVHSEKLSEQPKCQLDRICDSYRYNYSIEYGDIHPDGKFRFLNKLKKEILTRDFGLIVSFVEIKKNNFDLLKFPTVHRALTTDDISKIKKYTISLAYQ